MKLFRNGKVYIQVNDIWFLKHLNIADFRMVDTFYAPGENSTNYVCFDKKSEVDFFKNLDFIIDYDEYANLNIDEIQEKINEIKNKINITTNIYNNLPIEEKSSSKYLREEIEKLEYMKFWISIIYEVSKVNNTKILMPNNVNNLKK